MQQYIMENYIVEKGVKNNCNFLIIRQRVITKLAKIKYKKDRESIIEIFQRDEKI